MSGDERDRQFFLFGESVRGRLEKGRQTYGERSWSRDPVGLVVEVQEELLDVSAWSFILWTRLEAIRQALGDGRPDHQNAPQDQRAEQQVQHDLPEDDLLRVPSRQRDQVSEVGEGGPQHAAVLPAGDEEARR